MDPARFAKFLQLLSDGLGNCQARNSIECGPTQDGYVMTIDQTQVLCPIRCGRYGFTDCFFLLIPQRIRRKPGRGNNQTECRRCVLEPIGFRHELPPAFS